MCGFECGNGFSFVNTTIYNPPRPRPALGPPDEQTNLYENLLVIVEQLTKKCSFKNLPCQAPPPPRPADDVFGPPPPLPLPRAAAKLQFIQLIFNANPEIVSNQN